MSKADGREGVYKFCLANADLIGATPDNGSSKPSDRDGAAPKTKAFADAANGSEIIVTLNEVYWMGLGPVRPIWTVDPRTGRSKLEAHFDDCNLRSFCTLDELNEDDTDAAASEDEQPADPPSPPPPPVPDADVPSHDPAHPPDPT
eukprot:CAMPEP_0113668904 /NCGR_PEP_ID=MMETSP0038_2-20120614/4264_1 /TAXON_ID=2898 /ORGANISM="Cryptomonas paramecium" /LENGTH=145 /DNA_ID=CAMNT_0000584709 /DNA_START=454 /DNA_END=888 /DNA_ORIENTATION=- /assembly_acc=CAM_ASM_000170